MTLLTTADQTIVRSQGAEKSPSASWSLSALPASEVERHQATCLGSFQFFECQRELAHSSWVAIDLLLEDL